MIVLKTVGARNCYFATNAGVTDIHEKKKTKKRRLRAFMWDTFSRGSGEIILEINVAIKQIRKNLMKSNVFKKLFAQSDGLMLHTG